MRIFVLFLLFLILFFSLHYLFYSRVVRKLLFPDKIKRALVFMLAINYLSNIGYVAGRYTGVVPETVFYIFSLSIGITFALFMYLLLHEIANILHKVLMRTKIDEKRRKFIKNSGDGVMLAAASSYISIGAYEGAKEPVVNIVEFGEFDFSIVQISDLHIGGLIDRRFVANAVKKINALSADIICITGDLIDTKVDNIKDVINELNYIRSKYGTYYVLGNHEYFHDPESIIEYMQDSKIKLLLNDSISIDELQVNIIGVTDLIGYRMGLLEPDIKRAYDGCKSGYKNILLAHQPKFVDDIGDYRVDLMLSGHTHGGQIWPFGYLVRLQQPYLKGLHKLPNGGKIFVNSGIGFWGPPMRLGSHSEITYLV